ncbi:pH signaling pathway protein [Ophiocordyceps camponoti-floridani]|uniref:pH signaling pathway protein n=1 Tax=Ophiocordyceps camponoti-floridani TaxID=2030778 RepID=A0A8H4VF65_9HYPO|nr:pH signaling pathway protein [Ophiocordyceps camponoti-floridani]
METLTYPSTAATLCTTTSLVPAKGFLAMTAGPSSQTVVYEVPCPTLNPVVAVVAAEQRPDTHDSSSDARISVTDPFYASTFPICYALAAATVTAYMLLIMLFVTPRSFLDGGVVYLGRRRGFIHSSSGGENIGGRPWLQKVATLTVAISLTIATHHTFEIAQRQYLWGAQNAGVLQTSVMGRIELRAIRLISDTFLWLAQAQTLIRLFPRHREKVIIKWAAFALITLNLIFTALNSFNEKGFTAPVGGSFRHPIPALSYLFQLLLGVLYAAWVIYYSLMKKRYAFYHPLMKNMPLLAIISLTSILIPVVFFIVDFIRVEFTSWGDYVRWVGAAAASVIVWEWVERIEALEREEKKDGILGREVFDGDDTLEVNASESPWLRHRKMGGGGNDDDEYGDCGGGGDYYYHDQDHRRHRHHHHHHHHHLHGHGHHHDRRGAESGSGNGQRHQWPLRTNGWPGVSAMTGRQQTQAHDAPLRTMSDMLRPPLWPSRPAPTVTPVSRTDTPSAASTVYAVRYQGTSDTTSRTPDPPASTPDPQPLAQADDDYAPPAMEDLAATAAAATSGRPRRWRALATLRASSPAPSLGDKEKEAEEDVHRLATRDMVVESTDDSRDEASRWDIRSRLELFAANQAEKLREKLRPSTETESLPVTVIPAPPRQGTALRRMLEEETTSGGAAATVDRGDSWTEDEAPTNPPLWPGVRREWVLGFEETESAVDDSLSEAETASMEDEDEDELSEV